MRKETGLLGRRRRRDNNEFFLRVRMRQADEEDDGD